MLNRILSVFPFLEVIIRVLYWKSRAIHNIIQRVTSNKKKKVTKSVDTTNQDFSKLLNVFETMGLKKGDTLIVHSAYGQLKRYGLSPEQIIDELIKFIGAEGNLIMPAIPILRNQPNLLDRFKLSNYLNTPLYDVNKSRCWTGALAQCLVKKEGALRSRSPLNSMVVFGRDASEIVRNDLFSNNSLACGENSVLALSLNYNAKMLFLGVDEVHSMTIIHVAEDLYFNDWPIKNWFWKRPFEIIDGDYHETVILNERNPFWALFYAERRFSSDLLRDGIIIRNQVDDLSFAVCEGNALIHYLRDNNKKGYPYRIPFWYRRNSNA
jgi:aminoglycoside N3'-acetyltransferase